MSAIVAAEPSTAVHASAVAVGEAGILIRGASGAGKSSLADALIIEATRRGLFGCLIGDDRIRLAVLGGRVTARPHPAIAGLMERRGLGIVTIASEAAVVLRFVADIALDGAAQASPRLPEDTDRSTSVAGVVLPRLVLLADHTAQEQARRVLDAIGLLT